MSESREEWLWQKVIVLAELIFLHILKYYKSTKNSTLINFTFIYFKCKHFLEGASTYEGVTAEAGGALLLGGLETRLMFYCNV